MIFDKESEFEEAVIAVLEQHGWDDADGVLRYPTEQDLIDNWAQILYRNNSGIDRLNGVPLTKGEMDQVIEQVESLKTPYALNGFINGKTVSVLRDNEEDSLHFGKEVSLKIYDRQEIAAGDSRYQIAQQPVYPAKSKMLNDRRGDLCLLINGMPVIHIELKRSGIPVSQATSQIEKYSHEGVFTGLFSLAQIFVAMTPDEAKYFANPGRDSFNSSYFFHWEDFNNEPICAGKNPGSDEWKRFISELLSIPMAHKMIGFYTVADAADKTLKVMRSYQYYAASAISDVVRVCKWDEPRKNGIPGRPGGYIWHTTGSGKTMTSFKSAQLIADSHDADKVIFLMDRIELGTQSLSEYQNFADNKDDVSGTKDTGDLKAKLSDNDPSKRLIVTSIQKMSNLKPGSRSITQVELDKLAKKRIVFVIDECHRSTFGDMLHDIRCSFPNALFFGFTGTPVFDENKKKGSTTYDLFGKCLHAYTIADGIRDKNVLGFDTYMVPTFEDFQVRQAVALEQAKASSVEEANDDPNKSKIYYYYMDSSKVPMGSGEAKDGEKVRGIEDHLKRGQYWPNTPHHEEVVKDILGKFPIYSRGGKFHAMLATSSIPEAIDYYREFKAAAPELKVTALFDPNVDNNPGAISKEDALVEIISDYNNLYGESFTIPTWASMKKDISARLSHKGPHSRVALDREKQLDLLIVVDQMLTGFDSKWVNTLYLDKLIEYENLIQAFSRTNRLFGPDKPFGIIRYYRKPHTMKKRIEDAVALFSYDRPVDLFVQKLPQNIEGMNEKLNDILHVFESFGAPDLSALPESGEAKAKFAKDFIELNNFLDAAKVQGFTWDHGPYSLDDEGEEVSDSSRGGGASGDSLVGEGSEEISCNLDENTFLTLVQRYKELEKKTTDGSVPDVPYELDGRITEIDTGHIDTEYMNANFTKVLKCLHENDPGLNAALEELHRSFAVLSQEEQRYADLFLGDVQRGDVEPEEGKTFRDYITSYARSAKNKQVQSVVDALGVDGDKLEEMVGLDLSEENINEFARFDELKSTVDKAKAKAFFEEKEGCSLPSFKVNIKAANLLKEFVLTGGFDITDGKAL